MENQNVQRMDRKEKIVLKAIEDLRPYLLMIGDMELIKILQTIK